MDAAVKTRFEQVALPHLDAVFRIARALAGSECEADDLVQETFTRAYHAFDRFELRGFGPRPWLLRILHNVFYSQRDRRRRQPTLLDDVDFDHFSEELEEAAAAPVSMDRINWDQFDEELKAAVEQLRPEYRAVLLLWAFEGLSYKEIASVCGCAAGTVMSRLYRARQRLMHHLRDYAQARRLDRTRSD